MSFYKYLHILPRLALAICFLISFTFIQADLSPKVPKTNGEDWSPKVKASHEWIGTSVSGRSLWLQDDVV